MTDNTQSAYAKGYAAGRRKKQKLAKLDRIEAQRRAFRDRAFLEVLPWVFQQNTWGVTVNDKHVPYRSIGERVKLAWSIAKTSTDQRP